MFDVRLFLLHAPSALRTSLRRGAEVVAADGAEAFSLGAAAAEGRGDPPGGEDRAQREQEPEFEAELPTLGGARIDVVAGGEVRQGLAAVAAPPERRMRCLG